MNHRTLLRERDTSPFPLRRMMLSPLLALLLIAHFSGAEAAALIFPPEEDYTYDIHFLWFRNVAEGRLKIRRVGKRRYRAELVAATKGFIGFLTNDRKNIYVSEMDFIPEENRLRSRTFSKVVTRGDDVTRSKTFIEAEKNRIRWIAIHNGKVKDKGTEPIPEGVIYEDILSAFFNLRFGAYGPIRRGRKLKIATLPAYQTTEEGRDDFSKGFVRNIGVRIADIKTEKRYRRRFDRTRERGLLALVSIPKELFGQKTGEVRVWLDENLIPVASTVEDAIFFGDVTGILKKAIVTKPAVLERPQR